MTMTTNDNDNNNNQQQQQQQQQQQTATATTTIACFAATRRQTPMLLTKQTNHLNKKSHVLLSSIVMLITT